MADRSAGRTRLELFIGKGGVGKTTLACATAMAHTRAGARVLIASLDQAHSLGDALGFRFPHDPGTVAGVATVLPGLDVIEIDSLALLEDRFRDVVGMLGSGSGHEHGVDLAALDPAELTGLPGVQELLMLTEIAEFADEDDWDVIVVDCPPSADMLRIVTAPETLLGYLERLWPAQSRALSAGGPDLRRAVLAAAVERIAAAGAGGGGGRGGRAPPPAPPRRRRPHRGGPRVRYPLGAGYLRGTGGGGVAQQVPHARDRGRGPVHPPRPHRPPHGRAPGAERAGQRRPQPHPESASGAAGAEGD
ncbi:ArsA family ATPase [Nocardia wallacei]|uniref:ArsA family ATPase n=1 Tax=Nocardia wallacei TaxID=480035 RepID=UPI002455AAF7|nr:ArsA-related P-loop ATPase [Nocardia wallacei]